jgi:ATP-binding cassette, subfamily B, bacterial
MSAHELDDDKPVGKFDWALWRKVFGFILPYKRATAGLMIVAGVVVCCDIAIPIITGKVIDALARTERGEAVHVTPFVVTYISSFLILAVCIYLFILFAGIINVGVSADIRTAAFHKLQRLQIAYYDKRAVGWLMARLTSDCNSLSRVMAWGTLDIVWGTLVITGVSVAMFILNWKLALVVLATVPVLVVVSRFFQNRLLLSSRAMKKSNSLITAAYNEGIAGVRTTKSMVREEANQAEFEELTLRMNAQAVRNQLQHAVFIPAVASICAIGVAAGLWYGGVLQLDGQISLGTLVTFLQYAGFLAGPAQELANTLTMVQNAQASAERVQGLLDEPITIQDEPGVLPTPNSNIIQTIEFRDVSFEYVPGQPVLKNFSLTVKRGQTIALVGATGGGKSTIVSLVSRFYQPTQGQILFNGIDYKKLPMEWLQQRMGIVLQQPHLFSGTIRQNIRYGNLNATDEQVEQAARLTNAISFIHNLPGQFEAKVGEGGNQLSTGQKQLIALARAVVADPQVFIMDEATSSVDTQTERDIQLAVEHVLKGRSSFVIAHRLSTIKNADVILVIDQGQVIEQGNHHDLILKQGRYFELYTNQFSHEREEALMHSPL